jgi:hypothetical protein
MIAQLTNNRHKDEETFVWTETSFMMPDSYAPLVVIPKVKEVERALVRKGHILCRCRHTRGKMHAAHKTRSGK